MAEITPMIRSVIAGLINGGQRALGEQIRFAIKNDPKTESRLRPLDLMDAKERRRETRRQMDIADAVVRSVLEIEQTCRKRIVELAPILEVKDVLVLPPLPSRDGHQRRLRSLRADIGKSTRAFSSAWSEVRNQVMEDNSGID